MALNQPVLNILAKAPGYSFSGQKYWYDNSIWEAWMAAVNAYEASARTQLPEATDWAPTGITHTGPTAPADVPDTTVPGPCGSGARGSYLLLGPDGTNCILKFNAKDVVTSYRWVQDQAPIPSSTWVISTYEGPVGPPWCAYLPPGYYTPAYVHLANFAYDVYNVIKGLTGINASDLFSKCLAATSSMFWAETASGTCNYEVVVGMSVSANTITIQSSSGYPAAYIADMITATAQDGIWHQESKTSLGTNDPTTCAIATYVDTSNPLEDIQDREDGISSISGGGTWPITNIQGGCWSGGVWYPKGPVVTAPDVWDPTLTQEILDLIAAQAPCTGYVLEGKYNEAITIDVVVPGANYLTQTGNPFIGYNTAKGAYVWDIQLKKWGKFKADYSFLVDHNAANIPAYDQMNYSDLGLTAGTWNLQGLMTVFSDTPSEGYLKYGKIGYYRLGMVHFLEARLDFRRNANCTVEVEASLDGRRTATEYTLSYNVALKNTIRLYPNIRYRWYNLKISGNWDLQYMEVRANHMAARR